MRKGAEKKQKPLEKMTFEECFSELERLVDDFEDGQLSLSDSVFQFERGMKLIQRCTKELEDSEKKIKELMTTIDGAIASDPSLSLGDSVN